MALLVPKEGETELLDKCLHDALSVDETFTLKLYKTDITIDGDITKDSFTEADFDGYGAKTLTRAGWNAATLNGSDQAHSTYAQQTFTCNGSTGNTIYGYYVLGTTSQKVLWAEKFGTARVLAENDELLLTPDFVMYTA
jgi:hypothetical protein